ncbi:PhaM family polyhydroxyalkanoate granule multifunctional regulatory protein [Thiomonas intermedia]|uniref:PhaM family polyhydroxyalkanoate granule multifunctional regulatory protein n=1 Tax=Thiomonas intermedia TaxID=926 RepID=UPI0009A4A814|nr:PhaM family polyhydroxyalkanoate granule multifunctional regulatory protein [Thiomonas intermedia]
MAQIPEFKDFMPGMEFFQTLLKGAGMPSQFANWVAPTLDVEELEQKITDLKAVLGWLETHARMTQNMIQALEVQRMTVQALKTMNVDLQAFAKGMVAEPQAAPAAAAEQPAAEPEAPAQKEASAAGAAPLFDPMQWWNAMTQQFTELANLALQEGGAVRAQSATAAASGKPAARQPAARKAAAKPRAAAGARKTGARAKPAAKPTAKSATKRGKAAR